MEINIRDNIPLSNKYIRFIKWKLYSYQRKFNKIIYANVFLSAEGDRLKTYKATLKLGIPGKDIIFSTKSRDLKVVLKKMNQMIHRYLARHKEMISKASKIGAYTASDSLWKH